MPDNDLNLVETMATFFFIIFINGQIPPEPLVNQIKINADFYLPKQIKTCQ